MFCEEAILKNFTKFIENHQFFKIFVLVKCLADVQFFQVAGLRSKPPSGFMVNSAFHPSEVSEISAFHPSEVSEMNS